MAPKVYTKTGDNGTTSLLGGTKVSKDDWRLDAYGTVDELNSFLGLLIDKMVYKIGVLEPQIQQCEEIQNDLFRIGSTLSYDHLTKVKIDLSYIEQKDIDKLETWIDEMQVTLPELKNFIIPGGDEIISLSHVCRTISRRAERRCVRAQHYPQILIYLNRLSDYFFVLARYCNSKIGYKEKIWKN